jgi:hypothetical protein
MYALIQLLHLQTVTAFDVVVDAFGLRVVFPKGKEPSTDDDDVQRALDDRTSWHLYDDGLTGRGLPEECMATTIYTTSPNLMSRKFLKRDHVHVRYMPIWDSLELLACREVCFPDVARTDFAAMYRLFGGVIRSSIAKGSTEVDRVVVMDALNDTIALPEVNLKMMTASVGASFLDSRTDPVAHTLLHMMVAPTYHRFVYAFASDYIRDQVLMKTASAQEDQCKIWLAQHKEAAYASLRGQIFEAYAHRRLREGGDYSVKVVGQPTSTASPLHFPARAAWTFHQLGQLVQAVGTHVDGYYGIPEARNFAAVDAVILPDILLQCTVSYNHPIKMKLLADWISVLPSGTMNLYFVVPADQFDNFPAQDYTTAKGRKAKRVPQIIKDVKQWVLCVPF